MKSEVQTVLEYYAKLCKKVYKQKSLYFEKDFNKLYISNGDFVAIFDINVYKEAYDIIQSYFNFDWNKTSKYVVVKDGVVDLSILSLKENVQKNFAGQEIENKNDEALSIYYTGINAENRANKTQSDVWTDGNKLFVYNNLYVKPFKNVAINAVGINGKNAYAAHYDFFGTHVFVMPIIRNATLDRFFDIVSKTEV